MTFTPLLHLFLGAEASQHQADLDGASVTNLGALFFARLERYKGLGDLLAACDMLGSSQYWLAQNSDRRARQRLRSLGR